MFLDVPRLLHQSAKGSIGVGAPCVEEDAEASGLGVGVHPLADVGGSVVWTWFGRTGW